jgi:hypothetical protein
VARCREARYISHSRNPKISVFNKILTIHTMINTVANMPLSNHSLTPDTLCSQIIHHKNCKLEMQRNENVRKLNVNSNILLHRYLFVKFNTWWFMYSISVIGLWFLQPFSGLLSFISGCSWSGTIVLPASPAWSGNCWESYQSHETSCFRVCWDTKQWN